MTTKEIAANIREDLKQRGYNSRKIGVRYGFCGYSSVIYVTIKDGNIDIEEIRKQLQKYESIDRDERTGEILQGGNTYVSIQRGYE